MRSGMSIITVPTPLSSTPKPILSRSWGHWSDLQMCTYALSGTACVSTVSRSGSRVVGGLLESKAGSGS